LNFIAVEHSPDESIFIILCSFHPVKILEHPDFGKSFTEPVISTFFLIQITEDCATFSFFEIYREGYPS